MKNIPRIFIGDNISVASDMPASRDIVHYLTRVMRTDKCLVFGDGNEYTATLTPDNKFLHIGDRTGHLDPSNNITLIFALIKRTDDLLNMATQMGVSAFQPVITERTNANHINWERMHKIIVEASEQSNRNTVPKILPTKKFSELDLSNIVFADERSAYGHGAACVPHDTRAILIGPEGGFSETEFASLDGAGACGISLGTTILRAELAAAVAIAKVLK